MPEETELRLYFDNAATTFPKPPEVLEAVRHYMTGVGASAGRGAYREAIESGAMLARCRDAIRRVFHAGSDDHVIFTLNGTDAINLGLKSILRSGDHVVTTALDHNSVLRPLSALEAQSGVHWSVAQPRADGSTLVTADEIAPLLRAETRMVVLNHASNVTGVLQPLDDIAALCRERGILLLVDAAQSAGHVPIDLARTPVDLLATPGHKGLLGPSGTGLLLVRNGVEQQMRSVREGGTGSQSEQPVQPETLPDKFESGSHNAVGIAGLLAALEWIEARGVAALRNHELELCGRMIERIARCDHVEWFGPRDPQHRVGVFSVGIDAVAPAELSALLEQQFDILTRSGLHCAPLAHETIGTAERGGTTRLSLGPFLRDGDVDAACDALVEIADSVTEVA